MNIREIAVDSTAIISALIGGKALTLFDCPQIALFITTEFNIRECEYLLEKISKNYDYDYVYLEDMFRKLIRTKLIVYRRFDYEGELSNAQRIIGSIDNNDVDLLALALNKRCPIWSNDSHFQLSEVKDVVKVYKTGKLLDALDL